MVEYALTTSVAAMNRFIQGLPAVIRNIDPTMVLVMAGVVLFLAFTLSSRTRH